MIGWLLDTALYTGLLIALVLVLRRPAARLFGAQTAYALWALPFLRLLLPPIVLPASLAPKAAAPFVATGVGPQGGQMMIVLLPPTAPTPLLDWPTIVLAVWLVGALAFLAWRVVTYRWMREDLLDDARSVGEVGKIRLVETPALESPVAFGVCDKVIALPLLFMAQPDLAARDLAIAHELEHHRGRDLVANFAAQVLLALHWFNPLAWLAWRAMRRDQEAACDARVVAGKGREERVRYAELIAGTAAGRRLALAAPMACPVLGDASIIHRLRSLTMSDISPRRRLFGRALIGASALALPLTASFSYAAQAQDNDVPAPSAPPAAVAPPAPPAPPASEARDERRVQRFVFRTPRDRARDRRVERRFAMRGNGRQWPGAGQWPHVDMNVQGNPLDPEFQKRMEAYSHQMEEWSRKYGKEWERWGRRMSEQFGRQWGEQTRNQRFAFRAAPMPAPQAVPQPPQAPGAPLAPQAPRAPRAWAAPNVAISPEMLQRCRSGENGANQVTLPDGRNQVVICNRGAPGQALNSLRATRDRIARNTALSEDVRRDVLQDLDREIERLQRDGDD
jgi:bla regulator protein BlaR1